MYIDPMQLKNDKDEHLYYIALAYNITVPFRNGLIHCNSTEYSCSRDSKIGIIHKFLLLLEKLKLAGG